MSIEMHYNFSRIWMECRNNAAITFEISTTQNTDQTGCLLHYLCSDFHGGHDFLCISPDCSIAAGRHRSGKCPDPGTSDCHSDWTFWAADLDGPDCGRDGDGTQAHRAVTGAQRNGLSHRRGGADCLCTRSVGG